MELWIRSQNRDILTICHDVYYLGCAGNYICVNDKKVAEYKSEERALEVLNEIQKLLVGDVLCFINIDINADMAKFLGEKCIAIRDFSKKPQIEYIPRDCIVYEMPKE